MGLHVVAVPPAPFSLTMYPAAVRSLTIPNALRSVIPTVAAMSRSRAPGSRAMHSSTSAWLVRKPQFGTWENYHTIFPEDIASFGMQAWREPGPAMVVPAAAGVSGNRC